MPVGLTKKQKASLAIVLGLKDAKVDLSETKCLQRSWDLTANEFYLVDAKGEKVTFKDQPVIVTTAILSAPKVKSLTKPSIVPRKSKEKTSWMSWISASSKPARPIRSTKDVKPLSFAQNLVKVVRENYGLFCINRNVRSVRPLNTHIVINLKDANVDLSSIWMLSLDKNAKPKSDEFINEYFLLNSDGQKVLYNKKEVKVQTRLHKIKVEALKAPSNQIGQKSPAKKHAKAWFISARKKKQSTRIRAINNLVKSYTKEICAGSKVSSLG
eukprot:UN02091